MTQHLRVHKNRRTRDRIHRCADCLSTIPPNEPYVSVETPIPSRKSCRTYVILCLTCITLAAAKLGAIALHPGSDQENPS